MLRIRRRGRRCCGRRFGTSVLGCALGLFCRPRRPWVGLPDQRDLVRGEVTRRGREHFVQYVISPLSYVAMLLITKKSRLQLRSGILHCFLNRLLELPINGFGWNSISFTNSGAVSSSTLLGGILVSPLITSIVLMIGIIKSRRGSNWP